MVCKFCDDFTDICTNPESPMRGDCCPVPDTEGVCRFEDREEEVYKLTPNGCATADLLDAGLVSKLGDPRIDSFWAVFTELMEKNGYVQEVPDNGK